jgi:NADPH2:quinone reductase
MRAAVIERYGDLPVMRDVPEPSPADSDTLIDVLAAPMNPVDISIAGGRFYRGSPPAPFVPGREGIGRIASGGGLRQGTRVYFNNGGPHGSFAQQSMIAEPLVVEAPDGISDGLAASLGIPALSAWLGLSWRANLRKGETVLVLAASGVVGTVAVQVARLLGARRVVAAARDAAGLKRALTLGADAVVDLNSTEGLSEKFKEAAGANIDLVLDPLWGPPGLAALQALSPGGRLIQMGQSAGNEVTVPSSLVRGRMLAILGFTIFEVPWPVTAAAYRTLADHAAAGRLTVEFETFPLDQAPAVWELQSTSPHKKLVLIP